MAIKAIDTLYKGYLFRSRLEARWAVALDTMGAKWQYEPEGYDLGAHGLYLPDFWIKRRDYDPKYPNAGYFLEIKGQEPTTLEIDKLMALSRMTKHTCYLATGLPGENFLFHCDCSGHVWWKDGKKNPPGLGRWTAEVFDFALLDFMIGDMERPNLCAEIPMDAAKQARFEHRRKG